MILKALFLLNCCLLVLTQPSREYCYKVFYLGLNIENREREGWVHYLISRCRHYEVASLQTCVYCLFFFVNTFVYRVTSLSVDFLFFYLIFRLSLKKVKRNIFIGSSRLDEHLLFRRSHSVCVYRFMCKCFANLFLARNINKPETWNSQLPCFSFSIKKG